MTEPAGTGNACVDVVIVTTNRRELVGRCIEHLSDGSIASRTVVVNASTDGTADAVREAHPGVDLVVLPETSSLPVTNNMGAARGDAEFILFLNDDILALPGAVDHLVAALQRTPGAVAAGGRLVDPGTLETQRQYRPRTQPTLGSFAMQLLEIERVWPGNPITRAHWGAGLDESQTVDVEQPPGACLLVRRDAFEAVGRYDERFWVWFEDTDLTKRLAGVGSLIYVPTAVFPHLGGSSVKHWVQADVIRSRFQGMLRYAESHYPRLQRMGLAVLVAVAAGPRILAFSRRRPLVASAYREIAAGAIDLFVGRRVRLLVAALDQLERTDVRPGPTPAA
jgi:N-acetylglucosaminyl-diphospho-decaprenol L-rhamnosyltransferase